MAKGVWVNVSKHAFSRARERFDWDREKTKEMVVEAATIGDELPDELKEFYIYKTMPMAEYTRLMVYEDKCYVFSTKEDILKLITIYPIKNKICESTQKTQETKKHSEEVTPNK